MTKQPRDIESQLERLTTWADADAKPRLWESALDAPEAPKTLRFPSRRVLSAAACLMLGAVGVFVAVVVFDPGTSELDVSSGPMYRMADQPFIAEMQPNPDSLSRELDPAMVMYSDLEVSPRVIQRQASMELHTDRVRPLLDRILALVDPGLGEFVESSSATEERAEATLRVSASRLEAVMRSLREMDGVGEVHREELSAVDATDRRTDLDARLANERRVEAELLDLLASRTEAPLADVLRLREALSEVRLNIERLDAQRSTLNERVALATLRVSIVKIAEEREPEPDASGFLHDLGDAFARGGRTLAGSAAWVVETLVGGLIAWIVLVIAVVWAYRAARWRATWA